MMRPFTELARMPLPTIWRSCGQARHVVETPDVDDADGALALAVDGDPRGADLLAEDRQRAIGQRRHVRDLGVADGHLGEARVEADILGLPTGTMTVAVRLAALIAT
jgi:hypothetical protein